MNKVYFVGAGPAGEDLITVRGLEILRLADVVIYDYLVDRGLLGQAGKGAELICCDSLGKKRYSDGFLLSQENINKIMVKKAKEGKRVVRLKNGDTAVFSRLSQELNALIKQDIEFEIVPGVTAASAASGFCGIPLTDRSFSSSLAFVTGHENRTKKASGIDWESIAACQTIVLYMAVRNISKIAATLIKAGRSPETPVAAVTDAGKITQRTVRARLKDIARKAKQRGIRPPAVFIIGQVADFEKEFNWLRKNKRTIFTGLSRKRFFLKGNYFHLPLIKIEPLSSYGEFDSYLKKLRGFDWIVFSSRYGVHYFFERLNFMGADSRVLKDTNIAAIGDSTRRRLLDFGIRADLVPKKESSSGLVEEFSRIGLENKNIFLPRSDIADKGLSRRLGDLGAKVTTAVCYRNVMPKDLPDLDLNYFDEIKFSSPSGVRNFIKRYGRPARGINISCIGEVTRCEAKKRGLLG